MLSVAPGSASADDAGISEKGPLIPASESDTDVSALDLVPGGSPPLNAAAFFSRLQSQLSTNPNFQSFQHQFNSIQADLKTKVGSQIDFNRIDLADAQKRYESAMNQGEKYFKVASKELSDLFGEAVRIVSPEEEVKRNAGMGKMADKRRKDAEVAAAGRTESLLHRVRSDSAILLVDPSQSPASASPQASSDGAHQITATGTESNSSHHTDTRESFAKFLSGIEENGGIDGEVWKGKIEATLSDTASGQVLRQTFESIGEATIASLTLVIKMSLSICSFHKSHQKSLPRYSGRGISSVFSKSKRMRADDEKSLKVR